MNNLFQDLKYGFRNLKNKPGFTFIAILILTLGIGANTALFSILYSLLWKPLPYREPDRLAMVWESNLVGGNLQNVVNPANFYDWKQQNKVFSDMSVFVASAGTLNAENQPEEIPIQYAFSNFFQVLGTNPMLGRTFVASDDNHEEEIAVLSHGLWMRRFGGDKSIVGKKLLLNGIPRTIVGVMPEGFYWHLKDRGIITGKPPQLWLRWNLAPEGRVRRGRYMTVIARLKPGVSVAQADANMKVLAKQLETRYYEFNAGWGATVVGLREQLSGDLRKPLWILGVAVIFVLFIACSNVASLLLSRALARGREIAVRTALGAGRSRIVRQLLTESVLLSLVGGIGGILIAVWGVKALTSLGYRAGVDFTNVDVNWIMLCFALAVSVGTGLLFGLIPAITASRTNLNDQLKEGSRGSTGQTGRVRSLLVVTELAVTLVLLTGAALLIQSFWRLSSVETGFNSKQVLSFRVLLPGKKYPEDAQRITWFNNLLREIRNSPGVKSAGMVSFLSFAGPSAGTSFHIFGKPTPAPDKEPTTDVFITDDAYFKTLQIPLLQGRLFSQDELVQRRKVVVINEALAKKYFPGENAIGKRITVFMRDENEPSEIIGIVGNVKQISVQDPAEPSVYWPQPELAYNFMNIVVRTEGDPLDFAPTAASIVQKLDKEIALADVRLLNDWVNDSTARARFSMVLLVVLASLALVLALAGIYGVLSHTVLQRTQEMGIRMALGASSTSVFTMVLKDSIKLIAAGVLAGTAVSLALTRLMRSILYETNASDPLIFSAVIGFLLLAAVLACSIPSRRAAKVDPIIALRYE